ncbi:MAG: ACP S-malonyltransferase [Parachlamydiales bacterium]|jgi:[acyl-carrier-protein] S-malonyltransferase
MKKFGFIFPGQGSQEIAMGKDFYDNFPISREIFENANDILRYSLTDVIFNSSKESLDLTQNSQLAIFVNSVSILKVLENLFPKIYPTICAGLSLGEYTALYASKKISFEDAVLLIKKRATLMDEACKLNKGTMAAVLGMEKEDIILAIKEIPDVWIANLNTPKQIVVSGKKESVEQAEIVLKEKGAKRVIVLDVQGAFHSPFMKYAEENLKNEILKARIVSSDVDIVMNVSASVEHDPEIIKTNLIKQITSSVRWYESIREMDHKIDFFIEMGNGKTLSGMNKKIEVKANSISIEKVKDLKEIEKCF